MFHFSRSWRRSTEWIERHQRGLWQSFLYDLLFPRSLQLNVPNHWEYSINWRFLLDPKYEDKWEYYPMECSQQAHWCSKASGGSLDWKLVLSRRCDQHSVKTVVSRIDVEIKLWPPDAIARKKSQFYTYSVCCYCVFAQDHIWIYWGHLLCQSHFLPGMNDQLVALLRGMIAFQNWWYSYGVKHGMNLDKSGKWHVVFRLRWILFDIWLVCGRQYSLNNRIPKRPKPIYIQQYCRYFLRMPRKWYISMTGTLHHLWPQEFPSSSDCANAYSLEWKIICYNSSLSSPSATSHTLSGSLNLYKVLSQIDGFIVTLIVACIVCKMFWDASIYCYHMYHPFPSDLVYMTVSKFIIKFF